MTSKHGENYRYWRVVRVQEANMKVLQITENLSSLSTRFINDVFMDVARSERSCPGPLASRVFHSLLFGGLAYRSGEPSGAIWDCGKV